MHWRSCIGNAKPMFYIYHIGFMCSQSKCGLRIKRAPWKRKKMWSECAYNFTVKTENTEIQCTFDCLFTVCNRCTWSLFCFPVIIFIVYSNRWLFSLRPANGACVCYHPNVSMFHIHATDLLPRTNTNNPVQFVLPRA